MPPGMQRQGTHFDTLSRTEISVDVEQDFVRLHVGMRVGNLDRIRMMIQMSRRESAHDESAAFKRLLIRRRQMNRSCQRFEIPGVERVGIKKTVPADDVERMLRHDNTREPATVLDQQRRVARIVDRPQFGWSVEVSFIERSSQHQLAVGIEVAGR